MIKLLITLFLVSYSFTTIAQVTPDSTVQTGKKRVLIMICLIICMMMWQVWILVLP